MIKPVVSIVQYLLLQEAVTNTLNKLPRVFGSNEIPAKYRVGGGEPLDVVISDGSILLVSLRGGTVGFDSVTGRAEMQYECIGETLTAARALYFALFDAVHDLKNKDILISEIVVLGQETNYPETDWPTIITFGTALVRKGVT